MTNSHDEQLPPLPRWRIGPKQAEAAKYFNAYFGQWIGERVDARILYCLSGDLILDFDFSDPKCRLAVVDTFAGLKGRVLDKETAVRLSMQLAWNREELDRGRPLLGFTAVPERVWLPFVIKAVDSVERFGRNFAQLHLLCIGGFAAGYVVRKALPWGFLKKLAYDVGFTRRRPYDEPWQLLQLRFAGLIEPSDSDDLEFTHYKVNTAMKASNKALIQERVPSTTEEEDF